MSPERESQRRDDHCPACGEDIEWSWDDHELHGETVHCLVDGVVLYDVAVLDLQHLAAS